MKALITFLALSLFTFNTYAMNATHGMVLFGKEKLMAYHLPMFHKVHAYQVIFEYEVSADLKEKIMAAGKDTYLTFVPAPFDLEKFIANPHPIKGDIYSGHFEKDGVVIYSDVTLENPKMIYQAGIIKPMPRGTGINNYKLVGTPGDLYAVHLLDGGTQMDQIFKGEVNLESALQVKLTQKAINENYLISSYNYELLKEGDLGTIPFDSAIDMKDPNCYPRVLRSCHIYYHELQVKLPNLYFTDSVM